MILLDATKFDVSKAGGYSGEDIVRATLECLRLCLPKKPDDHKDHLELSG